MKTNLIKLALLTLLAAGIQSQAQAQYGPRGRGMAAARAAATNASQGRTTPFQGRAQSLGNRFAHQAASAAHTQATSRPSLAPRAQQTGKTCAKSASNLSGRTSSSRSATGPNTLGRIYSQDGRSFMNPTISTRSGQLQRGKVYQLKDGTKARYMGSDGYTSAPGQPTYNFSRFQVVQSQGKQAQQPSRRQPPSNKPSSRSTGTHQSGGDIMIAPDSTSTGDLNYATEGF